MSYEDAVKAVRITSINLSVALMHRIMDSEKPRSAIRGEMQECVKHIQHIVEKMGGMMWSNPWHGDVDKVIGIAVPEDWRDIRGGVSVRYWPNVDTGSIVEHDSKRWQVVVNFVHGGISGRYTEVFSVYAIIPA